MGGGGSSSPPQYNGAATAAAQGTANVNTGVANAYLQNTNQITPQGRLTYEKTSARDVGGNEVPSFTATQTYSPEQQAIYDKTTNLQSGALDTARTVMGSVNNSVGTPLDYNGIPQLPTDQTALRDQAYGALTARSNQDLDRQQAQQQTQLANQGIAAGSEAYNNAMIPLDRSRVDASNQATINAGNIAGQNLSQAQALRNSGIADRTNLRNQPLQDYSTLLGLGGGVSQPSYVPAVSAQIPATDVTTPAMQQYQGQMQGWQAGQNSNNALMGGLFGLGGSALGAAGSYLGMSAIM